MINQENGRIMDRNDQDEDSYPPSPLSSSPPREFDINLEDQYMPIDGNDHDTSSLASSLSIEHDQDYAISPVILTNETNSTLRNTTQATSSGSSSRVIRCPVCEKPMRTFYCAKCIQRGQFVTLEQYQTSKQENQNYRSRTKSFDWDTDSITCRAEQDDKFASSKIDASPILATEEMLRVKLRTLKRKTELLQALYDNKLVKLEETRQILSATKQELEAERKQFKHKESKIDLIKKFITSRKASVKKRQDAEIRLMDELKQHVSRRVYQLTQDIFPIEQVNLLEQNNSHINMETSPLLTFSDGSHHQIELSTAYSIVEPWLPSNGDYSSYSLWVNDNKDQAPVNESSERGNPALQIGAALSYTTHLVKNLASYLDVILPVHMEYDQFNKDLLNDSMFSYYVAKLNANVIHLCISQGIDISLLNSQRTLKNLLLLFDMNLCDLGRKPIIELDKEELAMKIEAQLANDLSLIQEDFYNANKFASIYETYTNFVQNQENICQDDDASDSEWEISDSINPIDLHQMAAEQSIIQQNSYISRPLRLLSSFWTASGS